MKLSDLQRFMRSLPPNFDPKDAQQRREYLQLLSMEPGMLYQELEMDSDYADCHRDTSFAEAAVELHSHSFYEILCCRTNCGVEYLVGTERYRLRQGDVVIVPPGVSHRPLMPEQMTAPYVRDVLWISEALMTRAGDRIRLLCPGLLRTAGTRWEELGQILAEAVEESQRRLSGWELSVAGLALRFLALLSRAIEDMDNLPIAAEKPELLERAMSYIEKNLSEKITLEQAAKHLFVSASTISQCFRKALGISFYRYVTQRRLIAAKTLIERDMMLEDVAVRTGFQDYSGFYRAFKQEYGISPRQYRNRQ